MLLGKYVVDGNLSPPFPLLGVFPLDGKNHRESWAAWDPSEGCDNQPLALQEAVLARFMESVCFQLDFGSCGLLVYQVRDAGGDKAGQCGA